MGGNQIGDLMRLELPPHGFHRIEFGRINRQPLDLNAPWVAATKSLTSRLRWRDERRHGSSMIQAGVARAVFP